MGKTVIIILKKKLVKQINLIFKIKLINRKNQPIKQLISNKFLGAKIVKINKLKKIKVSKKIKTEIIIIIIIILGSIIVIKINKSKNLFNANMKHLLVQNHMKKLILMMILLLLNKNKHKFHQNKLGAHLNLKILTQIIEIIKNLIIIIIIIVRNHKEFHLIQLLIKWMKK
jgi:hypothetical protein